jgi:hypothetical protein
MLQIEGKLYVIGGWNVIKGTRVPIDTIDVYDLTEQTWSVLTTLPIPKFQAGITNIGNRIFVVGGYCDGDIYRQNASSIECYDIDENEWYSLLPFYPKNIWKHSMASIYIPKFRYDDELLEEEFEQ